MSLNKVQEKEGPSDLLSEILMNIDSTDLVLLIDNYDAPLTVESCVDDPNKARNNFGSTFLKSNPNLTPQKLKILS